MTDFDNTFPEDQWAIIKNYANRRFIFDYKPLLTHYLGDILTEPVKKYNNDDVVFQVSFEHGLNKNQNDKCVNTSKKLKNLLKQKLKILKKDKDNKLDAKEAFMILNSFEQRWLEPDNISFNSNDEPQINIWGINPVHIPEFIPIKKFIEIKSDNEPEDKEKSTPISPTLIIILIFLTIMLLSFLQDCGSNDTALSNINNSVQHNKTVLLDGYVRDQNTDRIIRGASVILNRFSHNNSYGHLNKNYIYSEELTSDNYGYIRHLNLPKGKYDIKVKKKYYYERAITDIYISGENYDLSNYLSLTKKPFLSRLIDMVTLKK